MEERPNPQEDKQGPALFPKHQEIRLNQVKMKQQAKPTLPGPHHRACVFMGTDTLGTKPAAASLADSSPLKARTMRREVRCG